MKFSARCVKCGMRTTQIVKGMTNMNYSKETIRFVDSLVHSYAKLDSLDKCFSIDIYDIPDFDLHELSALLISQDDSLANESTGADNPFYEKNMLPALIKYMSNTTNKEMESEFNKAWRDGISAYHNLIIVGLLDERLTEYNYDQGYTSLENVGTHRYSNQEMPAWIA